MKLNNSTGFIESVSKPELYSGVNMMVYGAFKNNNKNKKTNLLWKTHPYFLGVIKPFFLQNVEINSY